MPLKELEQRYGKLKRLVQTGTDFEKLPTWIEIQPDHAGIYPPGRRCTQSDGSIATFDADRSAPLR